MNLLETPRLIIKPTSLENLDNVCELFTDPEVMRYIGQGVRGREETLENLKKMIAHQHKHGFSMGDVYEKSSGEFIGRAGLIYLEMKDDQPDIEVGYALHQAYWGKGYATELAKGFLQWGFENLAVERLVAVLRIENEKSRRVLEKAGMSYAGRKFFYSTEVDQFEIFKNKLP